MRFKPKVILLLILAALFFVSVSEAALEIERGPVQFVKKGSTA